MKLPNPIRSLIRPKPVHEVFLTLVLTPSGIAAAGWHLDPLGKPQVIEFSNASVKNDTWEDRTTAADNAIAEIEDKIPGQTQIQKVVLGLPAEYLTEGGEISPDVRPHIKKFTHALDLTPIGFVSIPQAIIFKMKKDEGMPPSVILLELNQRKLVLSVYKIGALIGQYVVDQTENVAPLVEQTLKNFKDLEVLPSRIILYGISEELINEGKADLLSYPWPTKANFLHFPKFDHLHINDVLKSVSFAGASEIATTVNFDQEEEESNVEIVDPQKLGFIKHETSEKPKKMKFVLPKLPKFNISLPPLSMPKNGIFIASIIVVFLLLFGIITWMLPKATVTILAQPQALKSSLSVTVDPTSTIVDDKNNSIPGQNREVSLSGEKTIAVSGSKKIGDPSKGSVTIYNKSVSSKLFKKGSVLIGSGLQFTLDSDVQVASASESIGSITFGKANGTITAEKIGAEGNLSSGTEFTFKDVSSNIAIARNDQTLTGGASRDVTVVTRSDYDALVAQLSEELLQQAKQKLEESIVGGEKLIDATIKTSASEKIFAQELNQEAKELSGKITLTISGISYNENDFATLFITSEKDKIKPGYSLSKEQLKTTIAGTQVKKDGKISLTATVESIALPVLDTDSIRKSITGKSLSKAQESLKSVSGIGGAEFRFRWSLLPNRLPLNPQNISVTMAIQE